MPVVSVRDISVHAGDLAIATHGRAFWILDDVEPLRELPSLSKGARLFAPVVAVRMRAGNDEAEATPPEVVLGENPPNGALIDYVVPPGASGRLVLDIVDAAGGIVRHYASDDVPKPVDPKDVPFPPYWIVTPPPPSAAPGMHRFVWDFHVGDADGPLAAPGAYRVHLTQTGHTFSQPLTLRRDPRVAVSDAALSEQMNLALQIVRLRATVGEAIARADKLRAANPSKAAALDAIVGAPRHASPDDSMGSATTADTTSLRYRARLLDALEASVESADAAPTHNEETAFAALAQTTHRALRAVDAIR
jgi:hypothetical protein